MGGTDGLFRLRYCISYDKETVGRFGGVGWVQRLEEAAEGLHSDGDGGCN